MCFFPDENHAQDAQVQLYLKNASPYACAADERLGASGGSLSHKKSCWCARMRHSGARWRPKSPKGGLQTPKVAKVEPESSLLGGPGHLFGENSR